ncbi:recombinase family protein [Succinivibrio sp. AGMB01872]|uniref:Recombinase family protein n=1 Tax=Succinivibrio faecicola TaxID=2820300 RepID=A0ABS7DI49_9GAMM|nr:recombinase family protein [Succinivibrio faecicola]
MKLDRIFEDKIYGKDRKRPELEKMLSYIREGDHIYLHSMDRLARKLKDLLDLLKEITDKGSTIHFVTQNLVFSKDESNPIAKLMLQVMWAVAEFERSVILERQREGIAAAKPEVTIKQADRLL